MSNKVDFAGVFRAALPKAYISSIELLPTNIAGPRNGVSYDEESDDTLQKNRYGKRKPKRGTARFDDATGLPKGLQVKAEITIRDFVRSDGTSTWYDNTELLDNLKINVVLARGEQAIERLQDGGFIPKTINNLKRRKKVMQKTLSVRKDNGPIVTQRSDMIDGRNVYCITYEVVFNLPNYNPRNLALFASTFINLKEYQLKKTPNINGRREIFQGVVDSQNIIKNGSVPVRSSIAILPDSKVWAGPVHFHEGTGIMAGAFHSSRPHPVLTQQEVPNLVVKDYRTLDMLKEADLLLKPFKKRRRKKLQNKSAQGNRIIKKDVYISEPDYAFNEINQVRFLFHMDFYKFIAEKTQFGSCFVDADNRAKKFIIDNTKITDITVTRNRVRRGLTKRDNIIENYSDRSETVAQSRQTRANRIRPRRLTRSINPALEDSREVAIGGIREIKLDVPGSEGIRTFTVSDFEMSKKTDGNYCYSVSMNIQDGTTLFAIEQKKKLLTAIQAFKEYHQMARRRENYDARTGQFSKLFIQKMEEQYQTPSEEQVINTSRRERRQVIQFGIASAPWLNTIATYADTAKALTNVKKADLVRAVLLMESLASPTSGTVQGLETVLGLLEDLEDKISTTLNDVGGIGASDPMMDEMDFRAKTAAFKGKAPKSLLRLEKKFKTIHDSNMQNSVGYDFLNLRRRNNIGLRVITTNQLSNRLSLENQKYYNQNPLNEEEEPKIDDTESLAAQDFTRLIDLQDAYYSYLTPARVMFGNQKINMLKRGRRLWNTKQYNTILSSLIASTTVRDNLKDLGAKAAPEPNVPEFVSVTPPVSFSSTFSPTISKMDAEDLQINVANSVFSSTLGVSTVSPAVHSRAVQQESVLLGSQNNEEDDDSFGVDPKELLGDGSRFATDRLALLDLETDGTVEDESEQQEDFSSVSGLFVNASLQPTVDKLPIKSKVSVSKLNPTNETNIIDKRLEKFGDEPTADKKKQDFVSGIPNQIKSVLLGSDPRANKNWFDIAENLGKDLLKSPTYAGLQYFNYSHINKIEVLVAFGADRFGNGQILDPKYARLTKELYEGIINSGRPFVCRMVTHNFEMFKKSRKLQLPEFNRHFILVAREDEQEPAEPVENQTTEAVLEEQTNEEVGDDLLPPTEEDREFISRLTEFSELNTTGRQMLRLLVRRNILLGDIMPEFTNTVYVQQPKTISRVGTTFASRQETARGSNVSQAATSAASSQPRRPMGSTRRPTTQPRASTTSGTSGMTSPRTTGGSYGGGSTGGGGY